MVDLEPETGPSTTEARPAARTSQRSAQPHRCNARVEDFLQVLSAMPEFERWHNLAACISACCSATRFTMSSQPLRPLQALFTMEFDQKVRPAWKNMRLCFKSEPGYVHHSSYNYLRTNQPCCSMHIDFIHLMQARAHYAIFGHQGP